MTFQNITDMRPAARAPGIAPYANPTSGPYGGPYGWMTPYVAAIAAQNDDIAARALMLRRDELHFIALCLALMGETRDDADHLGVFARGLGVLTRKSLVMNAGDLDGVRTVPALAKLPAHFAGGVWRPASYLRLAALMNDPASRKTLTHMPRITRRDVLTLGRLPEAYRTQGALKLVKRPRQLSEVLFAIELVRRVRTDLTDRQIKTSLENAKAGYIRSWVMKHYEQAPFPPAPTGALVIGGVDALRPLTCYADLARAAREFDNCIRTYLWSVLKGEAYFYRYAPQAGGKGVAIVELKPAPAIGWIVHEALGPNNDPIRGTDRAAIVAAFRSAGIGAAPQASNPNAWFDLD